MATIEEVKARYEDELLQRRGVVSVGVGLDNEDGEKVIMVGVNEELPERDRNLPETLDGYRVQIKVIGTPRAQ